MGQARDPLRWIDDPAIDPSLRDAVRAARDIAPSFDPVSGLARLESGIRAGAAAASASTLVAGTALALLIVAGLSSWPADRAPLESPRDSVPGAPAGAVPRAPEGAPHEPLSAPSDTRSAHERGGSSPRVITPPAAVLQEPSEAHVANDVVRAQRAARDDSSAPDDALAHEIAQLAEARRALPSDPARALALLEDGRDRYPSSVLGQERRALRVLTLAALDRDADARAEGERFLAVHPSSPFAERIRRALESLATPAP